jgi:hypothetical protein
VTVSTVTQMAEARLAGQGLDLSFKVRIVPPRSEVRSHRDLL